mmetsp:Transcript_2606/g.8027  ORF Transcript_2606/g.8027 Transcript_2606/m.8027 type:complete len:207 (-) Transcript_2606:525-1145(-)
MAVLDECRLRDSLLPGVGGPHNRGAEVILHRWKLALELPGHRSCPVPGGGRCLCRRQPRLHALLPRLPLRPRPEGPEDRRVCAAAEAHDCVHRMLALLADVVLRAAHPGALSLRPGPGAEPPGAHRAARSELRAPRSAAAVRLGRQHHGHALHGHHRRHGLVRLGGPPGADIQGLPRLFHGIHHVHPLRHAQHTHGHLRGGHKKGR